MTLGPVVLQSDGWSVKLSFIIKVELSNRGGGAGGEEEDSS